MRLNRAEGVPDPTDHPHTGCGLHVTDQPRELAVTFGRPLRDLGCKETNDTTEVEAGNPGDP
eukprot:13262916-Alexandrium_andersonii.AAC.1